MPVKDVQYPGKIAHFLTPATILRAWVLFSMFFTLILVQLPFYGDQATLVSAPAQFYYDSGFQTLILPPELETGHPPLYALIIALVWTVLGKSLVIVHLLSMICVLFLLTQIYQLTKRWLPEFGGTTSLLLVLSFPVLWAQVAGMGADILIAGLVLYVVNSLELKKGRAIIIGLSLLPLLSMRGWIWVLATGLFALWTAQNRHERKQVIVRWGLSTIPVILYYCIHYQFTGWWLMPEINNWANHRAFNTPELFAGKAFELTVRCLEFGMLVPVFIWLSQMVNNMRRRQLSVSDKFILCALCSIALFTLPFRGPIVIRYLLPLHLVVILAAAGILGKLYRNQGKWIFSLPVVTGIMMLSSHFIAYPQMRNSLFEYSWGDGSLAHLSYFTQREEADAFLKKQQIDRSTVYTAFPETKSFRLTNLQGDTATCITLTDANLQDAEWVIYSNVMNMIDYETEQALKQQFTIVQRWDAYPVSTIIYHRTAQQQKP